MNVDHKKLFIPGPVEVDHEVLQQMALPIIGHRSAEYSDLHKRTTAKLKMLMYSQNPVLISTSSGTGLMEMAIRSTTERRLIVFSIGAFGNRWFEIARGNGIAVDKHELEWGDGLTPEIVDSYLKTGAYDVATVTHNETSTGVMNHLDTLAEVFALYPNVLWCVDAVSSLGGVRVEVDKLGIDVCLSSSQKAIGLPPGLSFASISKKALQKARKVKSRGYYFDMILLMKYLEEKDYQYPSTPSVSHMFALDFQLDRILSEGLERRFRRHKELATTVKEWAKDRFTLFAHEKFTSNTVTCIHNKKPIPLSKLIKKLDDAGYQISNGYGPLKGKTFRIAHMGDVQKQEILELLETIDNIIPKL